MHHCVNIGQSFLPPTEAHMHWIYETQSKYNTIKVLWTDNVFLSAWLSHHCSHSCYPLPFMLEITWINCKAKAGWPILWWSSWTEKCRGENRILWSSSTATRLRSARVFSCCTQTRWVHCLKVNSVQALAVRLLQRLQAEVVCACLAEKIWVLFGQFLDAKHLTLE